MIKGNFKIKIIKPTKPTEDEELEEIIQKVGTGSHMIFRTKNKDDELFLDEL